MRSMRCLKRIGAGFLCVLLALAMLVSSALLVHEADHVCTGEDCPVCQALAVSGRLLRLLGAAIPVLAFLSALPRAGRARAGALRFSRFASGTPVSWKIRLNN